ncbi:MAG: peptidoglycan-N-acetylglucosamine deacetylase [Solirubrobacteraceae bacterium]|nr:peptidoglycan-N-acetylglucosamine deacetylase [Solirubrobacteraceae bacterium]
MHCGGVGFSACRADRLGPSLYPRAAVPGPSEHLAARRARSRARRRRRRVAAAGGFLVLALALAVLLVATGGRPRSSRPDTRTSAARGSPSALARERTRGRSNALTAAERATLRRLARLGRPIYCGGTHGHAVAFTFDDGPGPYTHLALKKLRAAHERATFFVVGRSIDAFPGYLRRELALGAIGDHTYTHPLLTALPKSAVVAELSITARLIKIDDGQRVRLFRPPYGAHDAIVDRVARRLRLLEILWNVDSADSLGANYAGIIHNVRAGLRPGSIILMHENRGQTIRALTTLLPLLHRRHLRSVSLPELLTADPPSARQLRRGRAGCARRVIRGSGG